MQTTVTFRHVRSSAALRKYAEEKLERVVKHVRNPTEAHVILSVIKKNHVAEISLHAQGRTLFAESKTGDLYSAIDLAIDKIDGQARKLSARRKEHQADKAVVTDGGAIRLRVLDAERTHAQGVPEVIRSRRIPSKPMSVEEAVMQMDMSNNEFLVFRNSKNESLSVIYRRKDGNYGLIESEAS
jgi:putative sigma-54 modulation protein